MQAHRSDPRILGRRTLDRDHRALAAILRPGMAVLDIGCGTGAITAGIARAVGPEGSVVGIDRDGSLLKIAREEHHALPNLRFEQGDANHLVYDNEFDIVTAARTLQWIANPAQAIAFIVRAAKPNGRVVVLDYNHTKHTWQPEPPAPFRAFFDAFLAWRAANAWDNDIGDYLPDLFDAAGLTGIECSAQDETDNAEIWSEVIENVGPQLASGGYCSGGELRAARDAYGVWLSSSNAHTLRLRAVIGGKP